MALVKERSNKKAIINIFTYFAVQIILTVTLFSRVTNAWNWECFGRPMYTISFENCIQFEQGSGYEMSKNEMTIVCGEEKSKPLVSFMLTLNPQASYQFCGGFFGSDPTFSCSLTMRNSDWKKEFIAFGDLGFECKQEKRCYWRIFLNYVSLFIPSVDDYVKFDYIS